MKKTYLKKNNWILILLVLQTIYSSNIVTGQTIYKGDSVQLSVTNSYRGAIKWQESVNGTTWVDIAGGTINNMWVKPLVNTQFRAIVTEEACDPIYSIIKAITISTDTGLVVNTPVVSSFNASVVNLDGQISRLGGDAKVAARGMCWSKSNNPKINDSKTSDGIGISTFNSIISGLTENTTYYIRSYTITDGGIVIYSNEITVTTLPSVTISTVNASNITAFTATAGGNITLNGTETVLAKGVCWNTSQNPTIADSKTTDGIGAGTYSSSLANLISEKIYYLKAYVTASNGITYYGEQTTFETSPSYTFSIQTTTVSAVSVTTANSGGNIHITGTGTVAARGICWSTAPLPTITDSKTSNGTGIGNFVSSLSGLIAGTTYFVRAYATSGTGKTSYGNVLSFTSLEGVTVTSTAISAITTSSAISGGTIADLTGGTMVVNSRGVCWSINPNPTIANSKSTDGNGMGIFTTALTGLNAVTKYYVRAYATIASGKTIYGNENNFTTAQPLNVVITTNNVANLTATSTSASGNITTTGFGSITERGLCWSTSQNPTVSDYKTMDGSGIGLFTSTITGLNPGSTYYMRVYAITDSAATVYGNQISFIPPSPLTITTTAMSAPTAVSASTGGNIAILTVGTSVTSRGVCWSNLPNPTIANNKTTDGTGVGSFISSLTSLNGSTIYYVRAYCITNTGITIYGNEVSFTTSQPPPSDLILITEKVSLITDYLGFCRATVTGTTPISKSGLCWSKAPNPTIADSKTVSYAGGLPNIQGDLTGLDAFTTYYVRAYATATTGSTNYGNQVYFTTVKKVIPETPVVITTFVDKINSTSVFVGAKATNLSFAKLGVCINTTQNPDISGIVADIINSKGDFDYMITFKGLKPGTKYYVRAYAIPGSEYDYGDPIYGNEMSFTTLPNEITEYSIKTLEPTFTTLYGANNYDVVSGGMIDGSATPLVDGLSTYGYCWSKTPNPTIANNSNVSIPVSSWSNVNIFRSFPIRIPVSSIDTPQSLAYSSVYYLRSFITIKTGEIIYSNQITFTTPAAPPFWINTGNSGVSGNNIYGLSCIVTKLGSETIVARGVCWKTTHSPTITDCHTMDGTATGTIESIARPIEYGIHYYFRAYVTGSSGITYYGNERSWGHDAPTVTNPTNPVIIEDSNPNPNPALSVTTNIATAITTNTASLGGTVSGSSTVSVRGVCISTSQNPTTNNSKVTLGSGLGNFSGNITGLISGTRYYVRAYAISASGTTYGNQITFITQSVNAGGGDMLLTYVAHAKGANDCTSMSKGYYTKVIYSKNLAAEQILAVNSLKTQYGSTATFTYKTSFLRYAAVIRYVYPMSGWNCNITAITIGFGTSAAAALNSAVQSKTGYVGSSIPYTVLKTITW
ncbi:hypothetical protein [Flavobacterium sp. W22_SRS_FP1]|uniref:hypothetical protein n=1 Tax=Flavobacterium sp. W22_SRS_FP1 TaxID=3240276 RepID=UPI003F92EFF4